MGESGGARPVSELSIEVPQQQASDANNDDDGKLKRTGTVWTAVSSRSKSPTNMPLMPTTMTTENSREQVPCGLQRYVSLWSLLDLELFSLAWAFAQLGWVGGPIVTLLFASLTYYTASLLADCYRSGDSITGSRNYTYLDAVRANLGGRRAKICSYIQYLNLLGVAIGYTVSASLSMQAIKKSNCLSKKENTNLNCDVSSILIFGAIQIILSQIQDFGQNWLLFIFSVAMSFICSSIGLIFSISRIVANGGIKGSHSGITIGDVSEIQKIWRIFRAVGDIVFAYSYSFISFEIQDTIKAAPPSATVMKKATLVSLAVSTIFYMFYGSLGYAAFGDQAPQNLLTSSRFDNSFWLKDIANIANIIHLMGAYQINCLTIFATVEKWASKTCQSSNFITGEIHVLLSPTNFSFKLNLFRLLFRSMFVMMITIISMILHFFVDVLNLIQSLVFWPLMVYFPVEMYIAQSVIKWSARWICLQILSMTWLVIAVAATAGSIAGFAINSKV